MPISRVARDQILGFMCVSPPLNHTGCLIALENPLALALSGMQVRGKCSIFMKMFFERAEKHYPKSILNCFPEI